MQINLDKLAVFGYPKEVIAHLRIIFETILETIGSESICSIVLIGSTARGELSYKFDPNGYLDIFSDYEFIIVLNRGVQLSSGTNGLLKDRFSELKNDLGIKSPLFDIDFGIVSIAKLKLTPNTLWSYEFKANGIEVYGSGALDNLKATTLDNMDFGNLNELIIVRLWNMLLHTDCRALTQSMPEYSEFVLKFYYARNILDILTIYLPNKNILASSYGERLKLYLDLEDNCAGNDPGQFTKAHDLKLNLSDNLTLDEAQNTFIKGYISLASNLSGFAPDAGALDRLDELIDAMRANGIFAEKLVRKLRRKKLEADVCAFFLKKRRSYLGILQWFFSDIRYDLFGGLICMHLALSMASNEREGLRFLKQAIDYLNKVVMDDIKYDPKKTFQQNWVDTRAAMFDFMLIWFYGRSSQTIDDLNFITEWSGE